jgi:hypothetical protein
MHPTGPDTWHVLYLRVADHDARFSLSGLQSAYSIGDGRLGLGATACAQVYVGPAAGRRIRCSQRQ